MILKGKKKRKGKLLISAYVSNVHIEHTPNPKQKNQSVNRFDRSDHFLGQEIFNEYTEQSGQEISMSLVNRKNHDLEGSLVDEVAIRWPKTRDDCFAARGFALPIHRRRKSTSSGKVGSSSPALFSIMQILLTRLPNTPVFPVTDRFRFLFRLYISLIYLLTNNFSSIGNILFI